MGAKSREAARRTMVAILLVSVSMPADAGQSTTAAAAIASASASAQPAPADERIPEIIVYSPPQFGTVQPERSLDEAAIESFGVSTVDELLAELQRDVDDEEEPLILVNGERVNDLDQIGAFPVEALRNVEVLPRGTAVRAGGRSGQRVVSLTLKRQTRSATVTAAPKYSTEGDWSAVRGESIFTYIRGSTRANVALRGRDESSLLESERDIIQPEPSLPFALSGNLVGFPNTSGEIDPLLSALAGQIVTVAPIPGGAAPTLSDFAAGANSFATTDLGEFRTLRPDTRNYDLNASFNTRLAPWLTSNATLRLNRFTSEGLRGLPSALFVFPQAHPDSPFSTDVGLLFYGSNPLRYRARRTGADANLTFNGSFGRWTSNLNLKHNESRHVTRTDRRSQFGTITLDDAVDPFATDLTDLISLTNNRASSRLKNDIAQLTFTGPAMSLPAGDVRASIEGRIARYRLKSESSFTLVDPVRSFRRSEQSILGSLDIPLTSRDLVPRVGDTSITAELGMAHFSDAGDAQRYAFGLTWEPVPALRLRGSIESVETPPIMQFLGDPTILTPDMRVFDPLTGETVDVTMITGGNPDLLAEEVRIKRLTGLLRLVPRLRLQLNAEYTDTDRRNFVSTLPEASAAIMLAFPERFIRDSNGLLTTVDLRPVNFDSDREKRLRWGLSMNAKLGGGAASPAASPGARPARSAASSPATTLQLTANHSIVFSEKIVIRPELDPIDVLGGGAIGIGGGRTRHQIDATASLTSGGIGARAGLSYRGRRELETRIGGVTDTVVFSPHTVLNLRAFADMRRILPQSGWAKGLRLSVDVLNVTNSRQRVRDSFGNTPLQYQPAYRDPLGRTIEFEIRKVF